MSDEVHVLGCPHKKTLEGGLCTWMPWAKYFTFAWLMINDSTLPLTQLCAGIPDQSAAGNFVCRNRQISNLGEKTTMGGYSHISLNFL